jgi:FKBP-type peptidyl-prolyl cis-trans isomerase FkpA
MRNRSTFLLTAVFAVACGSTTTSPSGGITSLQSTDLVVGTGATAVTGKTLTVNYTGWLYDSTQPGNKGTEFDTSLGRGPFSFVLGAGQVIAGWDQGVVGEKVGGQRQLVIPPSLAYGAAGSGPIPPNATLLFEVDLLSVS